MIKVISLSFILFIFLLNLFLLYFFNSLIKAKESFGRALKLCADYKKHGGDAEAMMGTILSNYGHTLRKTKEYAAAADMFAKATETAPRNPYYHASLGFTLHCAGRYEEAIGAYHTSLVLKDDPFVTDFLQSCLAEGYTHTHITSSLPQ